MQSELSTYTDGDRDVLASHYAAIIKDADDAIIANDLNGVITSWNSAAEQIYGYTAEEIMGRSVFVLFPPDKLNEEASILYDISNGKKLKHYYTTRLHKNGELLNISLTLSPIIDTDGKIVGISKIARKLCDTSNQAWLADNLTQHTDYYAAIIESSEDAIISKSLDGIVITWNNAAERIFGYSANEMIGKPITTVFPENKYEEEEMILRKISNGERFKHFRTQRITKGQKTIDVSVTISPIKDEDGKVVGVSKIARDVTELVLRDSMATKLAIRSNHFSAIVESSDDAIVSKTLDGVVTSWNSAAESIFGYTAEEMIGEHMTKIFPIDRLQEEEEILEKIKNGNKVNHFQTVRLHKDGHEVHLSVTISPVVNNDGKIIGASKIARDITEKIKSERKLWQLANNDNLTDLPNRRLFMKRIESEVLKASSENDKFTVMYMDLNGFKQVNDSYGHAVGDQLLIQVSSRLLSCFRQSDTLARLGGDEFAALLPGLSKQEDVLNMHNKIQAVILTPFEINNYKIQISVSIGIATFPDNGESVEALLHCADTRMYYEKSTIKEYAYLKK
ncbi:sensor domain-containing protein [Methylotenera sp. N17]|uniref:sensor domain-containing protein n=1 Tax=Methylotenera sp. N17 TaxID=1502761 RepID=UPI00068E8777|nr:sensor domain-containing diguanylate cyclase [Methylotenera sp. N17]